MNSVLELPLGRVLNLAHRSNKPEKCQKVSREANIRRGRVIISLVRLY